tara:strand:- start:255 stop:4667 length:4413 start_codon:yes stop_codon:yes gene_type:complete
VSQILVIRGLKYKNIDMFGVDDIVAGVIASTLVEGGKVVLGGLLSDKTISQKLDKAFNEALKKWSVNEGVIDIESKKIYTYKKDLYENVRQCQDVSTLDSNTIELIDLFKNEIINDEKTYSILNYIQLQELIKTVKGSGKDILTIKESLLNRTDKVKLSEELPHNCFVKERKNTDGYIGINNGNVYIGGSSQNLTEKGIIQSFKIASEELNTHKSFFGKNEDALIERKLVSNLIDWINSDLKQKEEPIAVVAGNAGYGKSVVMKQLLTALEKSNTPCLAIKSDKLIVSNIQDFQQELGLESKIEDLFKHIQKEDSKSVVIIDQIDALSLSLSSNRNPLNIYNRLINRLIQIDNVRVIISCRIFDLEYDLYLQKYNSLKKFVVGKLEIEETNIILNELKIETSALSQQFLEFLRVPLHLEIYSSIQKISTTNKEFLTLQELYAEYWHQKIIRIPSNDYNVLSLVKTITNEMFQNQEITISKRRFENKYDTEISYLASEGVITSIDNKIQFVHQSFFDYSNARCFVESGQAISNQILNEDYHQGLFIRSGLRHVLLYLREINPKSYIEEVRALLFSDGLRFHLKLLILNTIGFIEDVQAREKGIIIDLSSKDEFLYKIFIESVNSEEWYKELLLNHKVSNKLSSDFSEYSNHVFQLINKTLDIDTLLGLSIINTLPDFEGKQRFVIRLLYFKKDVQDKKYLALFDTYFDASIDLHGYFHFLENALPFHPDWVIQKLKEFYEKTGNDDLGEPFSKHYEEKRVYEKLLKNQPQKSIEYFIEILLEISEENRIAFEKAGCDKEFFSGHQFMFYAPHKDGKGSSDLLFFICDSVIDYLKDNYEKKPDHTTSIFEKLIQTNSFILHALTIPALIEFKHITKDFVFKYLQQYPFFFIDYRSCMVFKYYFKELIKEFYPIWTKEQTTIIDDFIINAIPKVEKTKSHYSKSGITESGKNWFGITKFRLLSMIPKETRVQNLRINQEFNELSRKFVEAPNEKPRGITITSGETTLPEKAYEKMKVEDWLKSFVKYQGDDSPPWDRTVREIGHSRKFESLCTKEPKRFYPIVKAAIERMDVPISYAVYGFNGLSKSNFEINEIAELFNQLVNTRFDDLKDFPLQQLVWSTDVFINLKSNQKELVAFLCKTIENHSDKEPLNDDLMTDGLNSIRGAAIDRLIRCCEFKACGNIIFETIEAIAVEANTVTRASAIAKLALLNNLDSSRNMDLYLKLNHDFDPKLLALPLHNLHPLLYLIHVDFDRLIPFFEKAIEIEQGHKVMSHILLFAHLNGYPESERLLNIILDKSEIAIKTVVHIAFENINDEKSFNKCNEIILRFLDNNSDEIAEQYSHSFYHLKPELFYKIEEYLFKYIESKAGIKRESSFYKYLEESLQFYQDKAIAEKCIDLALKFNNHEKPNITESALSNEPLKVVVDAYSIIRDYDMKTQHLELAMDAFDSMLKVPEYRGNMKDMLNKLDESIL